LQVLRHYDTYENLVHELLRPRGPSHQGFLANDLHLYVRVENGHQLTPRGTLWSPVHRKGLVVNIVPRGPGGWYNVELVHQAEPFVIALVDDGDEERGAVLGEYFMPRLILLRMLR
jgi:hypothetical protein